MSAPRLLSAASAVVAATQQALPADILKAALEVPVHLEDVPSDDVLAEGFEPDILGLFTGSPVGESGGGETPFPPQIHLYIANLWDYSGEDPAVFRTEVRLTYLHELGHFLGWGEEHMPERGLD